MMPAASRAASTAAACRRRLTAVAMTDGVLGSDRRAMKRAIASRDVRRPDGTLIVSSRTRSPVIDRAPGLIARYTVARLPGRPFAFWNTGWRVASRGEMSCSQLTSIIGSASSQTRLSGLNREFRAGSKREEDYGFFPEKWLNSAEIS